MREAEEALVERDEHVRFARLVEDAHEQVAVDGQPSRIVRIAKEQDPDASLPEAENRVGQIKAVSRLQFVTNDFDAVLFKRFFISGEARRSHHGCLRMHREAEPLEEIACPRRADNLLGTHAFMLGERCA